MVHSMGCKTTVADKVWEANEMQLAAPMLVNLASYFANLASAAGRHSLCLQRVQPAVRSCDCLDDWLCLIRRSADGPCVSGQRTAC